MSENKTAILVFGGIILVLAIFGSINIEFDSSLFFNYIIVFGGLVIVFSFIGLLMGGLEKNFGRSFEGNNILYFIIAINVVGWSLFFLLT
tara:strand:+ start:3056 stop:3325 length:270 start_codon:yes stop_codon:yes gene_type:complete